MSMADYENAVSLMREHPDMMRFMPPVSLNVVGATEQAMHLRLPPTYKRFVTEIGSGNFGSFDVGGLLEDVSDLVDSHQNLEIEPGFLTLQDDGMGGYYCLDCRDNTVLESPVVVFWPGCPLEEQTYEKIADDFGAFLLRGVSRQLRTS